MTQMADPTVERVIFTVATFQANCRAVVKHLDSLNSREDSDSFHAFLDNYPYAPISTIRMVALAEVFPQNLFPSQEALHQVASFVGLAALLVA